MTGNSDPPPITRIDVPDVGPRLQVNIGWMALLSTIALAITGVITIRDLQHDSTTRAREYVEMKAAFVELRAELREAAVSRSEIESMKWRISEIERRMLEHERATNGLPLPRR